MGNSLHLAVQLARRRLVQARLLLQAASAHRVQQTQRANTVHLRRVLRQVERHLHVALRAQVVDLVRLDLRHQAAQIRRIRQISVVQKELHALVVGILVQVVDSPRVERGGTADDAVHLVALLHQHHLQTPL